MSRDMKQMNIRRGDILNINIPADPSDPHKQIGERPCVVVSNDMNNIYCTRILYVPLTSKDKKYIPTHVQLRNTDCLERESIALCECLDGIDKSFIVNKIGTASFADMKWIERGMNMQLSMSVNNRNNPSYSREKSACYA